MQDIVVPKLRVDCMNHVSIWRHRGRPEATGCFIQRRPSIW
jgi:hypothetical protein